MIAKSLLVNGSARFLNTLYANDLTVSGTTTFADLSVTGNAAVGGTLNVGNGNNANTIIKLNGKQAIAGVNGTTYTWLRINDTNAFTSGVYFGSSIVRTDGSFQIGNAGANINMTTSAATFKVPININGTTYKWTTDGNINVNGITGSTGTINNLFVPGKLRALEYDIQTIANLGGSFIVAPTLNCSSTATITITALSNDANYNYSATINDSKSISSSSLGGATWSSGSKIKISGKINGTLIGTCDGELTAQMNTSSGALQFKFYSDNASATSAVSAADVTVMLITVGETNPVGIYMTSYDTNGYSHISLYGGSVPAPTVRIGNLQGLPSVAGISVDSLNNKWGIYTDNGMFSGVIAAKQGIIGSNATVTNNWQIGDRMIYYGSKVPGNDASTLVISTGTESSKSIAGSGTSSKTWMISAGTSFGVTNAGVLYATSANLTGAINATSGTIGSNSTSGNRWQIGDKAIYNTTNSMTSTGVGTYVGVDGIRNYKDANTYVNIQNGVITAKAVNLTGNITATEGTIGGASISNGILQIKNVNIAEQITAANINASGLTIGQSQVTGLSTDLANAQNTANTALGQSVWYATCPTAAATAEKVATISPATTAFTLTPGVTVNVKFDIKNSAGVSTLKLNVNGTGAKSIKYIYNGTLKDIPGATYLNANQMYQFRYDGTYWVVEMIYNTDNDTFNRTRYQAILNAANTITASRVICGTSSGYQNIGASVSFDLTYPLLYAATAIATGATSGTRDNNYLEINGINYSNNGTITSGAANKTIYLKGTVSGNTFTIAASPFFTTVVPSSADGCCYIPLGIMTSATVGYFRSSSELWAYKDGAFGPVSLREASAAAKTATNYLTTITGTTGISVHSEGDTSNFVNMNSNGVFVYKGGTQRAQFADTTIIGKPYVSGASDNESRIEMDYHSFKLTDREGSDYVYLSDLRGTNGITEIHDNFVGDGTTKDFYLSLEPTDTSYTVKVNGTIVTSEVVKFGNAASFNTAPAASSTIEIIYNTTDRRAKSFTLGSRKTNSTIGPMSVAVGYNVAAEGTYSFVEGEENTSSGRSSHAEGRLTEASGDTSHAEGNETMAIASHSHAEGYSTTSSGNSSHSEGVQTTASGVGSHAGGYMSEANGDYSFASGLYTYANMNYQTSIGVYNLPSEVVNDFISGLITLGYTYTKTIDISSIQDKSHISVHLYGNGVYGQNEIIYSWSISGNTLTLTYRCPDPNPQSGEETDVSVYYNIIIASYGYAFVVGNGQSNQHRSNAFGVDWNGGLEIYLDVDSSANASTAATSGTDKDLFNVIRSLGWVSTVVD